MWFHVVTSFATAWWLVSVMGLGEWSSRDLKKLLAEHAMPLSARSASNAIMELVGLFERSPVGPIIGQGLITGKNPRSVRRIGLVAPSLSSIIYSVFQMVHSLRTDVLRLNDYLPWPWTVYGCEKEYAIGQLIANSFDWLEITSDRIICKDIEKGASDVMGLLGLHRGT